MTPSPQIVTQADKGRSFRALHERDGAFIIPNPYDVGTARLLAYLGFEALATTSAGYAFTIGKRDGGLTREEALAGASAIASATDLPVSADLEHGFGDAPEGAAETIRMAAAVGVVGGSIEDSTGRAESPIYELELATERVRAAAEAAHSLPFPFTLTARAENYLHGRSDLKDTMRRLQAYQEAGADVLYAPGLTTKDDIAAAGIFGKSSAERSHGFARSAPDVGGTVFARREACERRQWALSRGAGRVCSRRPRDARIRDLHLLRRRAEFDQ